jgi:hypothetical protein
MNMRAGIYLMTVLALQIAACGEGTWLDQDVQKAKAVCVDVVNNIPCPSPASDFNGDGIPDMKCGLGIYAAGACDCLIQKVQQGVSEAEFEQIMKNEDRRNCSAEAVFLESSRSCMSDIPCPPGADLNGDGTVDTQCGVVWQKSAWCT